MRKLLPDWQNNKERSLACKICWVSFKDRNRKQNDKEGRGNITAGMEISVYN